MSCRVASAVLLIGGNYFHITKVPASQETNFWQFHNVLLNKRLIQGREFGSLYTEAARCKYCIRERLSKLPSLLLGKDDGCKSQTSPALNFQPPKADSTWTVRLSLSLHKDPHPTSLSPWGEVVKKRWLSKLYIWKQAYTAASSHQKIQDSIHARIQLQYIISPDLPKYLIMFILNMQVVSTTLYVICWLRWKYLKQYYFSLLFETASLARLLFYYGFFQREKLIK